MGVPAIVKTALAGWCDELHQIEAERLAREAGGRNRAMVGAGSRNEGRSEPPQIFLGAEFVVTGAISGYDRPTAEAAIRARGGYVKSAVRVETDALIVGGRPGRSKLTKARQYGVPEIDERTFLAMLARCPVQGAAGITIVGTAIPESAIGAPASTLTERRQERENLRARARAATDPITPRGESGAEDRAARLLRQARTERGPREW